MNRQYQALKVRCLSFLVAVSSSWFILLAECPLGLLAHVVLLLPFLPHWVNDMVFRQSHLAPFVVWRLEAHGDELTNCEGMEPALPTPSWFQLPPGNHVPIGKLLRREYRNAAIAVAHGSLLC